jgi:hypothetical protein
MGEPVINGAHSLLRAYQVFFKDFFALASSVGVSWWMGLLHDLPAL